MDKELEFLQHMGCITPEYTWLLVGDTEWVPTPIEDVLAHCNERKALGMDTEEIFKKVIRFDKRMTAWTHLSEVMAFKKMDWEFWWGKPWDTPQTNN